MKKHSLTTSSFVSGQYVAIKATDAICREPLIAKVIGNGLGVRVEFAHPPSWWEKRERARGLFAGRTFERLIDLFENHAGSYTCQMDGRQYHITHAPKRYFAYKGNEEGALRNGSFCRLGNRGLHQFMNGDYMGKVDPEGLLNLEIQKLDGWTEVNPLEAERLIPEVCR